jgi:integrase/recombinase XerD
LRASFIAAGLGPAAEHALISLLALNGLRVRAIDLAIGERTEGPLFVTSDGRRLDRHGAAHIARRVTRRAGISKHVGPHTLRHAFIAGATR